MLEADAQIAGRPARLWPPWRSRRPISTRRWSYHVRLIDLGERSAEVLYNAGLMYEKAGQSEKAARLYRDALEQQPDMPEALLNLGRILETYGKGNEARACWSKPSKPSPRWRKDTSDRQSNKAIGYRLSAISFLTPDSGR